MATTATASDAKKGKKARKQKVTALPWPLRKDSPLRPYYERFFLHPEGRLASEMEGLLYGAAKEWHVSLPELALFLVKAIEKGYTVSALRLLARHVFARATAQVPSNPKDWRPDLEQERVGMLATLIHFCSGVSEQKFGELSDKERNAIHEFLRACWNSKELQQEAGIQQGEIETALWRSGDYEFVVTDKGLMRLIPELYKWVRHFARDKERYPEHLSWRGWSKLPDRGYFPHSHEDGGDAKPYFPFDSEYHHGLFDPRGVPEECDAILQICGNTLWPDKRNRSYAWFALYRRMLLELTVFFMACRDQARRNYQRP